MGRKYQNMEIYNLAYDIAIKIYKITEHFPKHELGALSNQLRRAAVSLPSHIAEGSTRRTPKEFLMFLSYSYGSAKEINVQLSIAKDINYIVGEELVDKFNTLILKLDEFQAKIYLFMRNLEKQTPYTFYQEYEKNLKK
jgi:four helix bundle protein